MTWFPRTPGRSIAAEVAGALVLLTFALILSPVAAAQAPGTRPPPTAEQVEQAVQRGKTWLLARQRNTGNWETRDDRDPEAPAWFETGGQWGGTTALAVYALLASGEPHTEPRIAKAIEFLKTANVEGVYALSMRIQVWSRLPQTPETKQLIRKDVQKLLTTFHSAGALRGQHDYLPNPTIGYSHSRTNYGILGVWTAAQADIEIPGNYWKLVTESFIANQDVSGGWSYKAPGKSEHAVTAGMTAAGLATLFIAQDYLFPDGNIKSPQFKQSLDRGMKWLGDNFHQVAPDNEFPRDFPFPTIYGVERVGLASGLRYIGDVDWYEKIAAWLVEKQLPSGAWHRKHTEKHSVPQAISDTAFALLTLSRGRSPVAFAKLDYSPDAARPADWNARPRDVANLSRYITRQIEREVNWHIVTLRSPINHWHESSVLYVAGSKPPATLSADDRAKLKRFVEEGGLVFATSDQSSRAFSDWVRKLGVELFPDREWRELPAEHPLFTDQQFPRASWRSKPSVLGLSNGVRELMILLPMGDAGRWWQSGNTATKEELWQLAANVHRYAAGRGATLRLRGQTHTVARDDAVAPTRAVRVARLQYAGNWDPEPGGWRRLGAVVHNTNKIDLQVEPRPLGQPLDGFALAHLTGTDAIALDPPALDALRTFLQSGGTLLVDAAGGATAFAAAIEPVLNDLLPGAKLEPLPPEHPILLGPDGKKRPIGYRPAGQRLLGNLAGETRLQCLKLGDRAAVIFSREDLSNALVGASADSIVGYDPATATAIVTALVTEAR